MMSRNLQDTTVKEHRNFNFKKKKLMINCKLDMKILSLFETYSEPIITYNVKTWIFKKRDSVISIATGYGLDD
jgi:hypothetical protein